MENVKEQGNEYRPTPEHLEAAKAAEAKFRAGCGIEQVDRFIAATASMTDVIADYLRTLLKAGVPDRAAWYVYTAPLLKAVESEMHKAGRPSFKFAAQVKANARAAAGLSQLSHRNGGAPKAGKLAEVVAVVTDVLGTNGDGDAPRSDRPAEVTPATAVRIVGEAAAAWAKARDNDELIAVIEAARAVLAERKVEVPA